jgi:hypothetical protein
MRSLGTGQILKAEKRIHDRGREKTEGISGDPSRNRPPNGQQPITRPKKPRLCWILELVLGHESLLIRVIVIVVETDSQTVVAASLRVFLW